MNRRERRAALAAEITPQIPVNYVRTCERMAVALRRWLEAHPGERPRFALPPPGILAIATLDQAVDIVARDAHARELVIGFCAIGRKIGGRGAEPTIMMLCVVLERVGLAAETAGLEEFEAFKFLSRGGDA
jgi:hypothetical protein